MTDQPNNNENPKWLSDAILIALATFLGYLVAYRYEAGFMAFFGVPDDFIEIGLTRVLIACFAVFSVLLSYFLLFQSLSIFLPKDFGPFARPLLRISPFLVGVIISLLLYGSEWRKWIWLVGYLILYSILEFAFPLLSQKGVKGYRQKLVAQDTHDSEHMSTRLISHLYKNIDRATFFLFIFFLFVITFASSFGESHAMRQSQYLVISTPPEALVLRTYGDKMVCLPFDRKNKEFQKRFYILKITDNTNNLTFKSERVGPLKASISQNQENNK